MPSLIGTDVAANYLKNVKANGIGVRTLIVKLAGTNITNDDLNSVINYITTNHGVSGSGDSAFVIAGLSGDQTVDENANVFVSGTSDVVYLACQGTGNLTVATADMAISGLTVTVEAIFDQNIQNAAV
jgi:hypothetical protein